MKITDILVMVSVALGSASVSACDPGDKNRDGRITISEILVAVNNALYGCGAVHSLASRYTFPYFAERHSRPSRC